MSLHYLRIKGYDYFLPEVEIFVLSKDNFQDLIPQIERTEQVFIVILILTLYFIGFSIFKRRRILKSIKITSNVFFAISIIFFIAIWPTSYFDNIKHNHKLIVHLITNLFLLNSIILNVIFITNRVAVFHFVEFLLAIFIPPVSLFLVNKEVFLDSKVVLWKYEDGRESYFKVADIKFKDLSDSTLVWYKGIPNWIPYKKLKSAKTTESLI